MDRFAYWSLGRPGQPAGEVIASAHTRLRVDDDDRQQLAVPECLLWRGLV